MGATAMNNFDQAIKDFSKTVLQTPEFARFKDVAGKLEHDKEAFSILQDVQERIQTIGVMQQEGLPVSDEQQRELSMAQDKIRTNEVCMAYLRASKDAAALAGNICNQLTQETGIPFAGGGGCCG